MFTKSDTILASCIYHQVSVAILFIYQSLNYEIQVVQEDYNYIVWRVWNILKFLRTLNQKSRHSYK